MGLILFYICNISRRNLEKWEEDLNQLVLFCEVCVSMGEEHISVNKVQAVLPVNQCQYDRGFLEMRDKEANTLRLGSLNE